MAIVLVVDDEEVLLDMVAAFLEDLGHAVLTAYNGAEALAVLEHTTQLPQLIISDMMMPQMNGSVLAQHVRSNPRFEQIPIVLMSAARQRPHERLYDGFLEKPFDLDSLEALLEQFVA